MFHLAINAICKQLTKYVTFSERTEMTNYGIKIALKFCSNNTYFTFQKNFIKKYLMF